MTIIRPNKNQKKLQNFLLGFFGLLLIVLVWWGIVMYGILVDVRHNINELQKNIQENELISADFQNRLYGLIDLVHLENKAKERGFIKEQNPQYLKTEVEESNIQEQALLSL